jgi:hypothetical protein
VEIKNVPSSPVKEKKGRIFLITETRGATLIDTLYRVRSFRPFNGGPPNAYLVSVVLRPFFDVSSGVRAKIKTSAFMRETLSAAAFLLCRQYGVAMSPSTLHYKQQPTACIGLVAEPNIWTSPPPPETVI